jgi:hypothetical protein
MTTALTVCSPDDSSSDDDYNCAAQILGAARALFHQHPSWIAYFRELLGVGGLIDQSFASEERVAFERSPAFAEIQEMLATLRPRAGRQSDFEPVRAITVRLPKCCHEALRAESHRLHASMNQLCVSKLIQAIDPALVPSDF